jgi:hypothetical protein
LHERADPLGRKREKVPDILKRPEYGSVNGYGPDRFIVNKYFLNVYLKMPGNLEREIQ